MPASARVLVWRSRCAPSCSVKGTPEGMIGRAKNGASAAELVIGPRQSAWTADVRGKRLRTFAADFPTLVVFEECDEPRSDGEGPWARIDVDAWIEGRLALEVLDRWFDGVAPGDPFALVLSTTDARRLAPAALEILTRIQRILDRRNAASESALFDRILAVHRELHDLERPLVRADYDHALDTWQWLLRLEPDASFALQTAALFHDVERLLSEAEQRVEQHAADYQAFKDAHARRGASFVFRLLEQIGVDGALAERVRALIALHERPAPDEELRLLNDADALSFFSLNSSGFLDYFGFEHTRKKVAYTVRRMHPCTRSRLSTLRLRPEVASMLSYALDGGAREESV